MRKWIDALAPKGLREARATSNWTDDHQELVADLIPTRFQSYLDRGMKKHGSIEDLDVWAYGDDWELRLYAVHEKNILGFVRLDVIDDPKSYDVGTTFVSPRAQRRGVAAKLYRYAVNTIGITLVSGREMTPAAVALWKSLERNGLSISCWAFQNDRLTEEHPLDYQNIFTADHDLRLVAKPSISEGFGYEGDDFDHEGWEEDVDPTFEQNILPARLTATADNIVQAREFVMKKWIEREAERRPTPPTDLSNSCKFSSLFAREIFGGRLRGTQAHQFVELADGSILDLNAGSRDVQALGDEAHSHDDKLFWGNPEHKEAVDSCRPRVQRWVDEFMSQMNKKIDAPNRLV